jgi:hypothetical protein
VAFDQHGSEILIGERKNMKQYLLTIFAAAAICLPITATARNTESSAADTSPTKISAVVDMQVEKQLYDDFNSGSTNRIRNTVVTGYRVSFDDFWLRVTLKGTYRLKYLESAFNVRFYPYWTMRRQIYQPPNSGTTAPDLLSYLDAFEIARAYIKGFKEYAPQSDLTFKPYMKVGRDGMLNNCSQLFGNYLDQPAGGYGDSRYVNITGPFKNRIIFANQLASGFEFNIFDKVGGKTEVIIGGNLNNQNFYNATATQFYQEEDSRLSAGFFRAYQDLYFLNNRIHVGAGVRNYVSTQDSAGYQGYFINANYFSAQWVFDAAIVKDVKFYTELAMQKMSSEASTGVVRPINAGITLPTFGVLDTLAVEFENVANTFFSDMSMRDAIGGRTPTKALGWGIVVEKRYFERFVIDWGLYTGSPTGDMKTTLRLSSHF